MPVNKFFVWTATPDSVARGKISVLACGEVVLSVSLYLWIAWQFQTVFHIFVSILVAPIVLLRSPRSIKLGRVLVKTYIDDDYERADSLITKLLAGIFIALAFLSIYLLPFRYYIEGKVTLAFASSLLIMLLFTGLARALRIPLWRRLEGVYKEVSVVLIAIVVFRYISFFTPLSNVIAGSSPYVLPILSVFLFILLPWQLRKSKTFGPGWRKLGRIFESVAFSPSFAISILFRTTFFRIYASIYFLVDGIRSLPKNWITRLLCEDLMILPELVPGMGTRADYFSPVSLYESARSDPDYYSRVFSIIALAICYLPALAYRYSIKSTCWLYLPVIYLSTTPVILKDSESRAKWIMALSTKVWEWARLVIAFVTLSVSFAAFVVPARLAAVFGDDFPVSLFSFGSFLTLMKFCHGNTLRFRALS